MTSWNEAAKGVNGHRKAVHISCEMMRETREAMKLVGHPKRQCFGTEKTTDNNILRNNDDLNEEEEEKKIRDSRKRTGRPVRKPKETHSMNNN